MLQLPFPARQSDRPLAEAPGLPAMPRARLFIKRQLQKLRQAAHERFEGTLWRVASLGLIANLILLPHRFSPSSLAIGNAHPANTRLEGKWRRPTALLALYPSHLIT